jgi:uncharacterized protein
MTALIETFCGEGFHPLAPTLESIWIEDIAHALSNQCRFAGHTRELYSVAEHSVRVSWLVEELGGDESEQVWGLLHDGSEAYLGDWATPLKRSSIGRHYRATEEQLMAAICRRFALPIEQPDIVHYADAVMLATEVRDLMPGKPEHWPSLLYPHDERIAPWTPKEAKQHFLERFHALVAA